MGIVFLNVQQNINANLRIKEFSVYNDNNEQQSYKWDLPKHVVQFSYNNNHGNDGDDDDDDHNNNNNNKNIYLQSNYKLVRLL